ncbi:MAG: glycoside hydrolase, partial [Oscillospiraceae bacterium]|nr:glycoside hydrolase [Oscillospiraceae bacterium]
IACGPVFESFGPGYTRRGRHDVSEDVIENIQTCFFCSKDRGLTWSQPHYVLPGIQAREPDFVDLGDGSILFVNSDVYAARSVRQVVRNTRFGYVNEPLRAIFYGAESVNGSLDGYVPETVAQMENGLLIGARRHAPYAVSNDMGENWHRIDAPDCEYQPSLEVMPDGEVVTVWHHGGDSPFGQRDMHIGLHRFYLKEDLPKPIKLRAERMLSPDGSYFDNRFLFALTSADKPLAGQTLTVRYQWAWNEDGTYNTKPLSEFASEITVVTDGNGEAVADLTFLEKTADIFKGYSVDCVYAGGCAETRSDCLYCYVMSPKRGVGDRYPFYLMNGVLVLSPAAAKEFPFIKKAFRDLPCENGVFTEEAWLLACRSAPGAVRALEALRNAHIVEEAPGGYRCCRSTHQTSDCIRECRVSGNRVVLT